MTDAIEGPERAMRDSFEQWMASSNYPEIAEVALAKLPSGEYRSQITFAAWQTWKHLYHRADSAAHKEVERREQELHDFFCNEERAMGFEGDRERWTAEHSAIVLIRRLREESTLARAEAERLEERHKFLFHALKNIGNARKAADDIKAYVEAVVAHDLAALSKENGNG